ncbi:uncharacterized protein [Acropora muricata]|uniref:uncharacterized protein isoform X2 n=1 Tax=Acropora muricata TaxID=159855 RepID=UPI0034E4D892
METDSLNIKNSNAERWYCPHYERKTCLIHFQCCPEGKLYPCHKCHNEANVVIETTSVKDQEKDKAHGSSERNNVENTGTSVELATDSSVAEWNNDGDRLENQAEAEEHELFESPSNVVENTDTAGEMTTESAAGEWNNGGNRQENLADVEEQEPCESPSNVVENTDTACEMTMESAAAEWNNGGNRQENLADVEEQEPCESPSNVMENTDTAGEMTMESAAAEWNNGGNSQENLADVEEQELCESPSNVVENTDTSAELTMGGSAAEWNNEADQPDNLGPTGYRDASLIKRGCKDVKDLKPVPKSIHLEATASDCTFLQCRECGHQQEFSEKCESCGKLFAKYFCQKCKLLIEKDVDAYHCDKCGICRGNKSDNFHCDECNVCLSTSLKGNHKCFTNRGHDPCAICLEEVFSGAIVLPCFHMIHGECGVRLLQFGNPKCPMCRRDIFPPANQDAVIVEDPSGQNTSSSFPLLRKLVCKLPNFLVQLWERTPSQPTITQQPRSVEMSNLPG